MINYNFTEAHPIDPGILYCCYTANNNDWSHRQQKKYQSFVKLSLMTNHKPPTNKGMLITLKNTPTTICYYFLLVIL